MTILSPKRGLCKKYFDRSRTFICASTVRKCIFAKKTFSVQKSVIELANSRDMDFCEKDSGFKVGKVESNNKTFWKKTRKTSPRQVGEEAKNVRITQTNCWRVWSKLVLSTLRWNKTVKTNLAKNSSDWNIYFVTNSIQCCSLLPVLIPWCILRHLPLSFLGQSSLEFFKTKNFWTVSN